MELDDNNHEGIDFGYGCNCNCDWVWWLIGRMQGAMGRIVVALRENDKDGLRE